MSILNMALLSTILTVAHITHNMQVPGLKPKSAGKEITHPTRNRYMISHATGPAAPKKTFQYQSQALLDLTRAPSASVYLLATGSEDEKVGGTGGEGPVMGNPPPLRKCVWGRLGESSAAGALGSYGAATGLLNINLK